MDDLGLTTFAKIDNGLERWTQKENSHVPKRLETSLTSTTKRTATTTWRISTTIWRTRNEPIPEKAQFGLIGVIFRPESELPWTVQDNRKALKNEFPCQTKADVLDKIAIILDDMHLPPTKLDRDNDHVEVTVAVTLQASLCDLGDEVNIVDLRRAAAEAVENAVHHHEEAGFNHFLADRVSLGTVEFRALNVE